MNYARIQQLEWYLPDDPEIVQNMSHDYRMRKLPRLQAMATTLYNYRDVAFGWRLAKTLAENDLLLPSFLDGPDSAVTRAYYWCQGHTDPAVETAVSIATFEDLWPIKTEINSYLIVEQVLTEQDRYQVLDRISRKISVPFNVVRIYEKLFFNVVDRMGDAKYIKGVIYPRTRMVELSEQYADNEDLQSLLVRTAYNNGTQHLDHLMGGRNMFGSQTDAKEFAERLETTLMAQGMLMAQNGYLNSHNVPAVNHARTLIAAAKAGGVDTAGETQFQSMGEIMMAELRRVQDHQFSDIPEAELVGT